MSVSVSVLQYSTYDIALQKNYIFYQFTLLEYQALYCQLSLIDRGDMINPRHACAAKVMVVVLCVFLLSPASVEI